METEVARQRRLNAERGYSNRLKGEKFEYFILDKLRKNSHFTIRSAGSHSLADVISVRKNGHTWLVSCKRNGYHTPKELKELKKLQKALPDYYKVIVAYVPYGEKVKNYEIEEI